jgi:glycosyltransferase involved in cell wall biosynthesis
MKILMVSIPSLHFFRWSEQLKDSGHEVYWFDITGMSQPVERIKWVSQKTAWKLRWDYPGRFFIKSKFPSIYHWIQKRNEKDTAKVFEAYLNEIKPDVVHSFALYLSCTPIISVMEKYTNLKWIYSSWGSDLFYFQNNLKYLADIKKVLPRLNYLFTDCQRDYEIAKKYGFEGEFLGVFPGGGGFDLVETEKYKIPINKRRTIAIKGFQGRSGRAIPVLKALILIKKQLEDFELVVFGASQEVNNYVQESVLKDWKNLTLLGTISHNEVLQLMGRSLVYVGNSDSDGIPNTLLEAIIMDVLPFQSNPGGATAEIIQHGMNGLLLDDPEDAEAIKQVVLDAINDRFFIEKAIQYNSGRIKPKLDFQLIKHQVINKYNLITQE